MPSAKSWRKPSKACLLIGKSDRRLSSRRASDFNEAAQAVQRAERNELRLGLDNSVPARTGVPLSVGAFAGEHGDIELMARLRFCKGLPMTSGDFDETWISSSNSSMPLVCDTSSRKSATSGRTSIVTILRPVMWLESLANMRNRFWFSQCRRHSPEKTKCASCASEYAARNQPIVKTRPAGESGLIRCTRRCST